MRFNGIDAGTINMVDLFLRTFPESNKGFNMGIKFFTNTKKPFTDSSTQPAWRDAFQTRNNGRDCMLTYDSQTVYYYSCQNVRAGC